MYSNVIDLKGALPRGLPLGADYPCYSSGRRSGSTIGKRKTTAK